MPFCYNKRVKNEDFLALTDSLLHRDPHSNKGDYGRALIIGGSASYPFAPAIAARFATAMGPGYVALALGKENLAFTANRVPLSCVFPEDALLMSNRYSAILFGNGLENNAKNQKILLTLLKDYEGVLVIDATGLEILKEVTFAGKNDRSKIILTPHLGEARRLLNSEVLSKDPEAYVAEAQAYSEKNDVLILLKSYRSILLQKGEAPLPSDYEATPSLAQAGSGDALAGLFVGLLARSNPECSLSEKILYGDELFHRAARLREKEHPYLAGDIETLIPYLERAL